MKIVILGAGQVGETIADNLVREDNDITLVDINPKRLRELQLKLDIQTVCGSATHPKVLTKAGAEHADMLIAVTDSDEVNMLACFISYHLFHTPKKVARIRSQDYLKHQELFAENKLPIDVCISPETLITHQIKRLIEHPGTSQVLDFAKGRLQLVSVKVQPGGLMVGQTLSQLYKTLSNIEFKIASIFRKDQPVTLMNETTINVNDEILFLAEPTQIQHILIALGHFKYLNKRIIIGGGGHIGRRLASLLEETYNIKIIEHNSIRAEYISTQLKTTTVLQGDIADRELLLNENIEFTDVFIAVTNDDEANIMSCLQAKKLGVRTVMALINRKAYVELIEDSAIDYAISPQLTTISSILTQLRRGDMVSVHTLRKGNAEALEVIAHGDKKTSNVVGRRIDDIKLPPDCFISVIIRDENIIMADGDTIIASEDHVILLIMNKRYLRHVEKLFQVSISYFK
jgi:trk system potassium uptake protein TrkA